MRSVSCVIVTRISNSKLTSFLRTPVGTELRCSKYKDELLKCWSNTFVASVKLGNSSSMPKCAQRKEPSGGTILLSTYYLPRDKVGC